MSWIMTKTFDKSSTRSADLTRETRVVNSGLKASRSRMAQGFPVHASSGTARWRVPLIIILSPVQWVGHNLHNFDE